MLKNKPGDEVFQGSFKFQRHRRDQRLADFDRALNIKTRSFYSRLLLYLHNLKDQND